MKKIIMLLMFLACLMAPLSATSFGRFQRKALIKGLVWGFWVKELFAKKHKR